MAEDNSPDQLLPIAKAQTRLARLAHVVKGNLKRPGLLRYRSVPFESDSTAWYLGYRVRIPLQERKLLI